MSYTKISADPAHCLLRFVYNWFANSGCIKIPSTSLPLASTSTPVLSRHIKHAQQNSPSLTGSWDNLSAYMEDIFDSPNSHTITSPPELTTKQQNRVPPSSKPARRSSLFLFSRRHTNTTEAMEQDKATILGRFGRKKPNFMSPTLASRGQQTTPQVDGRAATPLSLGTSSEGRHRKWVSSAARRVGLSAKKHTPVVSAVDSRVKYDLALVLFADLPYRIKVCQISFNPLTTFLRRRSSMKNLHMRAHLRPILPASPRKRANRQAQKSIDRHFIANQVRQTNLCLRYQLQPSRVESRLKSFAVLSSTQVTSHFDDPHHWNR